MHLLCVGDGAAQQLGFRALCRESSELLPGYDRKYVGQLLAFTPIYMFEDLNRYTYAMYYIFALISTIAFGDIIGKNYIEDVCLPLRRPTFLS